MLQKMYRIRWTFSLRKGVDMHKFVSGLAILFVSVLSVAGQEAPPMEQPTDQHEWLKKFVGTWDTESKAISAPGEPGFECNGTITSRSVGDFWIVNEMKASLGGTEFSGIQTIGYDAKSKKYVGTWVDSMNSHMWKYEGTVSEDGATLTLNAKGPNMLGPGEANYRDIYEFKSKDEMVIKSEMEGPDGKWITFMTGTGKKTE